MNSPAPVSRPRPPILVGGGGEQKTLRLVAEYADACNLFVRLGAAGIRRKLEVLERHCDEIGRDYGEIERTAVGSIRLAPGAMAAKDAVALCRSLASVGIQHAVFNMPNAHEIFPLETFGREVVPAVAAL